MTEYFNQINTKSTIKSDEPFTYDDARKDLWLRHQKLHRKRRMTKELVQEIDELYKEWCDLLFGGHNVAVAGGQSKFSLLETFRHRYLASGRIPDFKKVAPSAAKKTNGKKSRKSTVDPMLNVTTVRLHGFESVTREKFAHALFGLTETRRVTEKDFTKFVSSIRENKEHHVFMVHSFESFFKESEEVWDMITKLYSLEKEFIHIILSSDCINGGKKLNGLKFSLNLFFYLAPYEESFIVEKMGLVQNFCPVNDEDNMFATGGIFEERVNLQSLKDVYVALGGTQPVLVYIIERYVETRAALEFDEILQYCLSKFILRTSASLKSHVGELRDHRIVQETGTKIKCLVDVRTCKKFLEYAETEELQQQK